PGSLAPVAVAAVLGGGWIMAQAHGVFLGVGMDMPGVLVLLGLLVLMLVRPLSTEQGLSRPLLIAAAAALILGTGLSVAAQVLEPMVSATTA
ncbi:MAG TPA: peptidase M20, partial [Brevundimonas sp.]|nr:peptidase M20 [Brevundimonas sp.]